MARNPSRKPPAPKAAARPLDAGILARSAEIVDLIEELASEAEQHKASGKKTPLLSDIPERLYREIYRLVRLSDGTRVHLKDYVQSGGDGPVKRALEKVILAYPPFCICATIGGVDYVNPGIHPLAKINPLRAAAAELKAVMEAARPEAADEVDSIPSLHGDQLLVAGVPKVLSDDEAAILRVFSEDPRACRFAELRYLAGVARPDIVLKSLKKRFPELKVQLSGRDKKGYFASVKPRMK